MKKIVHILCFAIIVIGLALHLNNYVQAASSAITFESEKEQINNGEEFSIKVYISSDSDIGAYHVEIDYDEYRLQYIDGGDSSKNGRIILEGTGYGDTVTYKLTFKAISGGKAEISCKNVDIRVEGKKDANKQKLTFADEIEFEIAGKDTAVTEYNKDKYDVNIDIPIAGVVEEKNGTRYYIIDHSRYIPETVDFEYRLVNEVYDSVKYTFITNMDNNVKFVYMTDKYGNIFMYSYSKINKAFYPCDVVEDNGIKYYIMSANSCDEWAEGLTLDYIKKENICYAMSTDGVCGFYKYEDGTLTLLNEEGQEFLDNQMNMFYWILIVVAVVMTIIIAVIVIESYKKQKIKEKKRKKANSNIEENAFEMEIINVDTASEELAKEKEEKRKKSKPVIAIKDVVMKFDVSTSSVSGIKEFVISKLKRKETHREFTALNHVSIDVHKGEVLGLIGTNGSGKSTLLKLVAGAMYPTSGKIKVDRDKVQLLSLGTGFDNELTARENIYLSGAIIGYSKQFIDENFDSIIEFAELEDFVDEKVKNFSSGMVSRLAFSIATIGEAAEILILDEILSVGDEFFKKKSLKRVKEIIHGGSTVIMVAHNMGTIIENCTKVVWLEKGKVKMIGAPNIVCKAYRKYNKQ